MTVSSITPITLEGQPQELSSFLRSGVVYVVWHTPVTPSLKRLSWKPHTGLDFTEIIPDVAQAYKNITTLYDPVLDRLVAVWDDGNGVDGSSNGTLHTAHFAPTTGAVVYGPVALFQGSNPRLAYRSTTPNQSFLLHYRTPKTGGVYGRLSTDGGTSYGSGYPLITGKVAATQFLEVTTYSDSNVGVAQLGAETRQLREVGMFNRTRPLTSILGVSGSGQVGHPLDGDTLALWRLDEAGTTWADATGNFPLTQTGSPASIAGRVGNARRFSTSGQYALGASTQAARDAIIDGEFTIEFWWFVSTAEFVGAPVTGILFSLQGDQVSGEAQNALYQVSVASPTRALNVYSQTGANVGQFGPTGVVAPLDAWTHFAWRSQADGLGTFNWDVFMNGVFVNRRTLRVAPGGGSLAQFQIGAGLNFGTAPHATLDDIRISKVPRTDAQILASATGQPYDLFVGEPSKFDNTTLVDNLRGGLVRSVDGTKLYHLDGVQQGVSDSLGAVTRLSVVGTTIAPVATAGPTGNGDDLNTYTLAPASTTPNVDLPGASFAVALDVSSTHAYVAEYADNSAVLGQFIVVDLTSGTTGTVVSGLAGVRAVAVANFLATPLIFVGTTESGVERLRVYQQNALTPTSLLNTKLTSRANFFTVTADPTNPTGVLLYASLTDRLNIYRYISSLVPVQLVDSITLAGGGSFFQSKVASNGNVVVATGNAGVLVLDSGGKILAQLTLSGEVIPEWKASTVYALNQLVRPRASHQFAKSRYYFKVTNIGTGSATSGVAEPSWASTGITYDPITPPSAGNAASLQFTPVGLTDGVAVGVELDEVNKRIYAVGSAGGLLGTDGRVWVVSASGLL